MALRVATLETVFVANIQDYVKKTDQVDKTSKTLEKSNPTVKVKADEKPALAAMSRVQDDARKIDSTTATAKIKADASGAKGGVREAQAELQKVDGKSATLKVKADTAGAKSDIKGLGKEGSAAGKDAGEGMSAGILAAIIALPVAGTIVGIGAAIGKSLVDGLQVEVRTDKLMAQTDLDPKQAGVIGRAAGEAYANNFGPSIAENMDAARVAIQGGLLDPDATAQDSQKVIESLSGVAEIIGEEIPAVSRATAQLLRTGLAKDAAGAFDLLVRGTKAGLNISEDLLDTVGEYSTKFRALGLEGPQAFGLLAQAVRGGARDTDIAADALKEFSIRAIDGSKTSADGYKALGLSAKDMSAQIAQGGVGASKGLDTVLDRLRAMEDPVARDAAAVALFGTQAEDMGAALGKMDLSTAVAQLGTVKGAAQAAIDTLGDNTAGALTSAQRNIDVAADGIKGALAVAFAPKIKGFATFVTENRAPVMQFLLDLANGAIDAGRALINGAAGATEAFGSMVGTVGPMVLNLIGGILDGLDRIPGVDLDMPGFRKMQADAEKSFASFDKGSKIAADALRTNLIKNGLDPAQAKLKDVALPLVAQAAMHDASLKMAQSIDKIGYAADGSGRKLALHSRSAAVSAAANKTLAVQIQAAVATLDAEALAGAKAGDTQADLTKRYGAGRQALIDQLMAMGLTGKEATRLANKYRAIPGKAETKVVLSKLTAEADIKVLQGKINAIKQGKTPLVLADTKAGQEKISALQKQITDIKQGKKPGIDADSKAGKAKIAALQKEIDAIKQTKIPPLDANSKAGKAKIAALQKQIDDIRQGNKPGIDANSAAGKKKISDLQAQITAIKQHKAPDVDANSKAAKDKITALQTQINSLKGKTITVKANFSDGTSTWGVNRDFVKRAGGGPIPGRGSRDNIPVLGTPDEHMLTVEDVKAAGGHKGVYAWRAALHRAKGGPISDINVSLPNAREMAALRSALSVKTMAFPTSGGGGNAANRAIGRAMLAQFGWGMDQWPPLDALWNRESGWRTNALNASSGAYGIPQSLPASKMGTGFGGADYRTNPTTQERWGMGYIAGRYVNPAGAWAHSQAYNWYGGGGIIPPGGMSLNEPNGKPERQLSGHQTESFDRLVAALETATASSIGASVGGSTPRTCTHIWQIDGREIGRAAVTHMDNVLSGGLTRVGVS